MMTTDDFDALFTREALQPFMPRTGSDGLTPLLEVWTPQGAALFVLAFEHFNDWDVRTGYLRAIGARCAQQCPGIQAIRFGSEAWMRRFTETEFAARGDRLVEDYDDKEEVVVVFGQQIEGPARMAVAPLFRRPEGQVERVGTWTMRDTAKAPLLDAFWQGYQQGKGAQN